ncbi:hypothetical protein MY4824_006568 [Beauveria thailandica]
MLDFALSAGSHGPADIADTATSQDSTPQFRQGSSGTDGLFSSSPQSIILAVVAPVSWAFHGSPPTTERRPSSPNGYS